MGKTDGVTATSPDPPAAQGWFIPRVGDGGPPGDLEHALTGACSRVAALRPGAGAVLRGWRGDQRATVTAAARLGQEGHSLVRVCCDRPCRGARVGAFPVSRIPIPGETGAEAVT
jgi:hypothetical protein